MGRVNHVKPIDINMLSESCVISYRHRGVHRERYTFGVNCDQTRKLKANKHGDGELRCGNFVVVTRRYLTLRLHAIISASKD